MGNKVHNIRIYLSILCGKSMNENEQGMYLIGFDYIFVRNPCISEEDKIDNRSNCEDILIHTFYTFVAMNTILSIYIYMYVYVLYVRMYLHL